MPLRAATPNRTPQPELSNVVPSPEEEPPWDCEAGCGAWAGAGAGPSERTAEDGADAPDPSRADDGADEPDPSAADLPDEPPVAVPDLGEPELPPERARADASGVTAEATGGGIAGAAMSVSGIPARTDTAGST
jgi:hypothetical protein